MKDLILRIVARTLIPFIIMYGLYIIFFGHVSPGGGFSGGAVLAAGFILYRLIFEGEPVNPLYKDSNMSRFSNLIEHRGMQVQAVTGVYTFLIGIIFVIIILPIPYVSLHGNWFNVANGFKVAISLVKLFYLLIKTEEDNEVGKIGNNIKSCQ